jgi:hypothetical protein
MVFEVAELDGAAMICHAKSISKRLFIFTLYLPYHKDYTLFVAYPLQQIIYLVWLVRWLAKFS